MVPVGGGLGLLGPDPGGGELAGDGPQHVGGGDPAWYLAAGGEQDGQAVVAVASTCRSAWTSDSVANKACGSAW